VTPQEIQFVIWGWQNAAMVDLVLGVAAGYGAGFLVGAGLLRFSRIRRRLRRRA
jgi:hypothetical protein